MKIAFMLLGLITFTSVIGQNLKPANESKFFVQVPPKNLDHLAKTKIFVEARYSQDAMYKGEIENGINRDVYQVLASELESDWKISFNTRNTQTVPMKTRTDSRTSTDKAGKTTTSYTYYSESTERYEAHLELIDKGGVIIQRYDLSETFQHSKSSSVSYNAAQDDFNNTRMRAIEDKIRGAVRSLFLKLQDDYLIGKHTIFLYPIEIKSRKFDYADLNEAATLLDTWFKSNPTDLSDANIIRVIGIYEQALKEYEPESKKVRVNDEIAAVCYYALACINTVVKDYRKANEQILKSEELDKRIHHSQESLKVKLQLLKDRKVFS